MLHFFKRLGIIGLISLTLFVHYALFAVTALADSDEKLGENLFGFPFTNTQAMQDSFESGNLFLFDNYKLDAALSLSPSNSTIAPMDETASDAEGDDADEETEPDAVVTGTIARVIGNNINLRESASTDSQMLAQLGDGVTLKVIVAQGQWLQVQFGVLTGYVNSINLFQVTSAGINGYIMHDGINLRAQNNTDAQSLTTLDVGTCVQVMDYVGGWYQVVYKEQTGFIRSDCIKTTGPYSGQQSTMLMNGMSGTAVKKAQTELKRRGFYSGTTNEGFGDATQKAVEAFQAMADIDSDGILGGQTMSLLYATNNNYYLRVSISQKVNVKGKVKMTDWNTVKNILPNGATIKVIDVRTGVYWNEKVSCGHNHKDVNPLSAADTAKLKRVYGGSWTWGRRPVWVVYKNYVWAASMNGMPHAPGLSVTKGNGFSGVHCIHFLNSRGHASGKIDSAHKSCVREAYNAGK